MKKILQVFVLVACALGVRAQQSSYNDVAANRDFTIYSEPPSCAIGNCGDCEMGFMYWQYGFYQPSTGWVWPDITDLYNGTPLTVRLPVGTTLFERWKRLVNAGPRGDGTCNYNDGGNVQFSSTIAITAVEDLRVVASLTPTLCQAGSAIDLTNYVNKSFGVTFFVDGNPLSGTVLNPAGLSAGSHQVSARYNFTNGPTTIVVGQITILTTVSITANPSGSLLCPGEEASFIASGVGSGAAFQWEESVNGGGSWSALSNNSIYSNVNAATLGVSNVNGKDGYLYRLRVDGSCNTVYSTPATLNVYPAVAVTGAPVNRAVCPGGSTVFTAGGTPRKNGLSYQWQIFNGSWNNLSDGSWSGQAVLSGTGTASLTVSSASRNMNGVQFRCLLKDGCGSATQVATGAATLSIYADVTITNHPSNQTTCGSGIATYEVAATAGTGALVFRWQQSADGGISFTDTAIGSTIYGTYAGVATNRLTLSNVSRQAHGLQFRCVVTDGCGSVSQAVSRTASLSVYAPVSITANPSSQTICPNGSATFSVAGSGNGALSYQWQLSSNNGSTWANAQNGANADGAVISGAQTAALSLSNWPTTRNNYQFRCAVTDACGAVNQSISGVASVTLYSPVTITSQPSNKEICPGGSTTFSVSGVGQNGSPQFQWQLSSNGGNSYSDVVNGGMYAGANTSVLTLAGAGSSAEGFRFRVRLSDNCGAPTASVSNAGILSLFDPVAISSQPANKTICPNGNTTFVVAASTTSGSSLSYQWQESADLGTTFTNLANSGTFSGTTSATLTLTAAPASLNNRRYRVVVKDDCGTVNQAVSSAAVLTFNTSASISTHPASITACVGGTANFSIAATGTGLSYQWQESRDGGATYTSLANTGPYAGATTASLSINGTTSSFAGYRYRAVVSGSCNSVTSNHGVLSVIVPPMITADPASLTVCTGLIASFSVTASGTSLTYQWQRSTTGATGTFTDITGANASSYFIPTATTGAYYRVTVSNGCAGGATSGAAQLVVNPATTISQQPVNSSICPAGSITFSAGASGSGNLSYQWQSSNGAGTFTDLSNAGSYSGVNTASLRVTAGNASLDNYSYRVRVTAGCGSINSNAAVLRVNPIPVHPSVQDPSRCGAGVLSATASSTATSPQFKWYVNEADQTAVFTGATYQVSNLTATTNYFVSVTSLGCESAKERVTFSYYAQRDVPLGTELVLCAGQGIYNLETDISDAVAIGSNFTWTAGGTSFSSKRFDPAVGVGSYTLSYDPPSAAKSVPYCFVPTTRKVTVIADAGEGGLTFESDLISNGNTINLCLGDDPLDIVAFPSIPNGSWNTVSGRGLSFSGNAVIFTPDDNSLTDVLPNVFRYTTSVNGCSAAKELNIYVKNNPALPVISGIPDVVCPAKVLSLSASVAVPGNYSFEWYHAGDQVPFTTGANLNYTVADQEVLQVRSINAGFGCRSEATLATIQTPFSTRTISASRTSINAGDYVSFTTDAPESGNIFDWRFGDGASSTERNPTHFYYEPGAFRVTLNITSNLGCVQQITHEGIIVHGEPFEIVTNVTGHEESDGMRIHPIPVGDELIIESDIPVVSVSLTDTQGRTVPTPQSGIAQRLRLNTKDLPAGTYMLYVNNGKNIRLVKVIKH